MSNYRPTPVPSRIEDMREYTYRELSRVGDNLRDDASRIHYRTGFSTESLSAAVSANWKCSNSNVLRLSTSDTLTLTGIAFKTPNRERVIVNVGTGVVALKNEGTESSASFRFALPSALYQLSANHSAIIWYDAVSSRHRVLSRT